jgi:hypothetical protein
MTRERPNSQSRAPAAHTAIDDGVVAAARQHRAEREAQGGLPLDELQHHQERLEAHLKRTNPSGYTREDVEALWAKHEAKFPRANLDPHTRGYADDVAAALDALCERSRARPRRRDHEEIGAALLVMVHSRMTEEAVEARLKELAANVTSLESARSQWATFDATADWSMPRHQRVVEDLAWAQLVDKLLHAQGEPGLLETHSPEPPTESLEERFAALTTHPDTREGVYHQLLQDKYTLDNEYWHAVNGSRRTVSEVIDKIKDGLKDCARLVSKYEKENDYKAARDYRCLAVAHVVFLKERTATPFERIWRSLRSEEQAPPFSPTDKTGRW